MEIVSGAIDNPEDLAVAHSIRLEVFVTEQLVPQDVEQDGLDEASSHFMAWQGSTAVATARLRQTVSGYKVERVAVLAQARGQGAGRSLVACVLRHVPRGLPVYVHAQVDAIGFWQRMGFVEEGASFSEGGIEHRRMNLAAGPQPPLAN